MRAPILLLVDDQLGADEVLLEAAFARVPGVAVSLLDGDSPHLRSDAESAQLQVFALSGQIDRDGVRLNDASKAVERIGQFVREVAPAMVLLDMRFDSGPLDSDGRPSGKESDATFGAVLAEAIQQRWPEQPVAFLSTYGQRDLDEDAQVVPYISKSEITEHALSVLMLRHSRLSLEQRIALLRLQGEIVVSDSTTRSFVEAFEIAPLDVPVMITGETGTGKEILARYMHRQSRRSDGPFVAVNVNAIPRDLFEASFFGHVRGAFTGAVEDRPGYFEQADGGTLFLDEIGELAADLQVKLLRALESSCTRRVGGKADIPVDVRLVAATNRADYTGTISELRDDFQFRLRGHSIHLDPLRMRREDIPALAEAVCVEAQKTFGKSGITLARAAVEALVASDLPGNVRELRQRVTSAVARTGTNSLVAKELLGLARTDRTTAGAALAAARVADNGEKDQQSPGEPESQDLRAWLEAGDHLGAPSEVEQLRGMKPLLDRVVDKINYRLAAASLRATRKPAGGEYVVTAAAQVLYDDVSIKGNVPARRIASMLGLPQTQSLTQADLANAARSTAPTKSDDGESSSDS
jgi:DNA-binding NtrC family response regulator